MVFIRGLWAQDEGHVPARKLLRRRPDPAAAAPPSHDDHANAAAVVQNGLFLAAGVVGVKEMGQAWLVVNAQGVLRWVPARDLQSPDAQALCRAFEVRYLTRAVAMLDLEEAEGGGAVEEAVADRLPEEPLSRDHDDAAEDPRGPMRGAPCPETRAALVAGHDQTLADFFRSLSGAPESAEAAAHRRNGSPIRDAAQTRTFLARACETLQRWREKPEYQHCVATPEFFCNLDHARDLVAAMQALDVAPSTRYRTLLAVVKLVTFVHGSSQRAAQRANSAAAPPPPSLFFLEGSMRGARQDLERMDRANCARSEQDLLRSAEWLSEPELFGFHEVLEDSLSEASSRLAAMPSLLDSWSTRKALHYSFQMVVLASLGRIPVLRPHQWTWLRLGESLLFDPTRPGGGQYCLR